MGEGRGVFEEGEEERGEFLGDWGGVVWGAGLDDGGDSLESVGG